MEHKEIRFTHDGILGVNITKEEFADRIRFMGYSITPNTEFNESRTWIEEASEITKTDRQKEYGSPLINFLRTAIFWSVFLAKKLNAPITPKDVCWMMSLLKTGREMQTAKRDNGVDSIGYVSLIDAVDRDLKSRGFAEGVQILESMTIGEMADFLDKLERNLFTSQR